jgi:hypothetical protein
VRSTYVRIPCHICGKDLTCAGAARTAHMRGHVNRGEAVETGKGSLYRGRFEKVDKDKTNG